MVMYVGLVLLSCLGLAVAGEEPLTPNHFQPQWNHGQLTTVCIQIRPHDPALCGPMVSPPQAKHQDVAAGRNTESESWVVSQPNPTPLRSAVLEGFIGNGPVYQMEPGRAVETLPPLVRVPYQPPPMAMVRAPEQPPHQPCLEHGMRMAGPPQQVMMAPDIAPSHFLNPAPQVRTIPFAPFGIQQQPPQQFQMRQAMGMRASNPQFKPAMRAADCPESFQQPGGGGGASSMRSSSSSFQSTQQQEDVKVLSDKCEEQEKEILKKKEEIGELKKQLERMSAKSSTSYEQKAVTTKSQQDVSMEKDVKVGEEKQFSALKSSLDYKNKKK